MHGEPLSGRIRNLAETAGLDVLGFADATPFDGYALAQSPRRDPGLSLANAKTIIVGGIYIGALTLERWADPSFGRTSRLYLSGFFLDVVEPFEPIAQLLREEGHEAVLSNGSDVDGSIIPLKLAAQRAGLGWQGKNSLLLSKTYGTFLALGGVLTDADLGSDSQPEPDRCGRCERCQRACPMGALDEPYVLNRSRCLSSLLSSDELPESARVAMQNRVVDCEICQDVCPWNRKHVESPLATETGDSLVKRLGVLEGLFPLCNLVELTELQYAHAFARLHADVPYDIFHRNVLVAMENARTADTA